MTGKTHKNNHHCWLIKLICYCVIFHFINNSGVLNLKVNAQTDYFGSYYNSENVILKIDNILLDRKQAHKKINPKNVKNDKNIPTDVKSIKTSCVEKYNGVPNIKVKENINLNRNKRNTVLLENDKNKSDKSDTKEKNTRNQEKEKNNEEVPKLCPIFSTSSSSSFISYNKDDDNKRDWVDDSLTSNIIMNYDLRINPFTYDRSYEIYDLKDETENNRATNHNSYQETLTVHEASVVKLRCDVTDLHDYQVLY